MFCLAYAVAAFSYHAFAQYSPQKLNVSGSLFQPGGAAVTQASVDFKIEILDKNKTCVLYSEDHPAQNLSDSKGGFSLEIGSGTSAQNYLQGNTVLSWQVFANTGVASGAFGGCPGGVTMTPGEDRFIRVYYNLGSGLTAMSPEVAVTSAAYAMVADTLSGKQASEFIQVKDDVGTDLNQSNVETVFSAANYAKLLQLLNNTFSAGYSFNGQRVTSVGSPTAGTDAVNRTWTDTHVADKSADLSGVGAGTGQGATLIWNASANRWDTGTPLAIDNTKLPLAGGTMSGPVSMGANSLFNVGDISMAVQKLLQLGIYNNAQEGALTLAAGDRGKIMYNTDMSVVRVWNGSTWSGFAPAGAAGGDLSGAYPNPYINVNAVSTVKIVDNAITVAKMNAVLADTNKLLTTDPTTGTTVAFAGCGLNQVMKFDASGDWSCDTVMNILGSSGVTAGVYGSSTSVPRFGVNSIGAVTMAVDVPISFPVTTVAGRTGNVTLAVADIAGLGSAALEYVGSGAGNVPQLDAGGKIPAGFIPGGLSVETLVPGNGILISGSVSTKTIAVDTGITANKILQLDSSGLLGIGTASVTAGSILDIFSTGANRSSMIVPRSTTADRPVIGVDGMIRYNTTLAKFEVYENGNWFNMATGSTGDNLGNHTATQAILAITGTAATPGYAFADGANRGMYAVGTGSVGFSTGSLERVRINSNGNVAIGTTEAVTPLEVANANPIAAAVMKDTLTLSDTTPNGAVAPGSGSGIRFRGQTNFGHTTVGGIWAETTGTGTGGNLYFATRAASGSFEPRMLLTSTGNVGIGTTNPSDKVEIVATTSSTGLKIVGSGNNISPQITLLNSGGVGTSFLQDSPTSTWKPNATVFWTNGMHFFADNGTGDGTIAFYPFINGQYSATNPKVIFTPQGNVGIGTPTPQVGAILDMNGQGTGQSSFIVPRDTASNRPAGVNGMIRYNTNTARFEVFENNLWVNMTPTGTGDNLGNHTATQAILATPGTAAMPSYTFNGDTDTGMSAAGDNQILLSTAGTERVRISPYAMTVNMNTSFNYAGDNYSPVFNWFPNSPMTFFNGLSNANSHNLIRFLNRNTNSNNQWAFMGTVGNAGASNYLSSFVWGNSPDAGANSYERMRLDGPGNLGIGTSAPVALLDVYSTGHLYSAIVVPRDTLANRPGGTNGMIRYNTNSARFEVYEAGIWTFMTPTGSGDNLGNHVATQAVQLNGNWLTNTGGTQGLRIDNTGNVAIGTDTPTHKLTVAGGDAVINTVVIGLGSGGVATNLAVGSDALKINTSGSENTAIGHLAMGAMTTGAWNTAVGRAALRFTTSGQGNVALGRNAGYGGNNSYTVAVGYNAREQGSGTGDVAIGTAAMNNPYYSGTTNVAIGNLAGMNLVSGSNNILIGGNVQAPATIGSNQINIGNTFYGNALHGLAGIGTATPGALLDVFSTGSTNSAIIVPRDTLANRPGGTNGMIRYNTNSARFEVYEAGIWTFMTPTGSVDNFGNHTATQAILAVNGTAATPSYSFAGDADTGIWTAGPDTLAFSSAGTERVRINSVALDVNGAVQIKSVNGLSFPSADTNVGGSIAIGPSALGSMTGSAAYGNIAIGQSALSLNTTGTGNVAIGFEALNSTTTLSNSTAIGYRALKNYVYTSPLTYAGNTAVGSQALTANTTGIANTAVGRGTLGTVTTGTRNTSVGDAAMGFKGGNSNGNTAIGASALPSGGIASYNTAVGTDALYNTTGGSNNTVLGAGAGYDIANGGENIVIGRYPTTSVGLTSGSNNILIGYDVRPPSQTGNNQLNIANLIYATTLGTGAVASAGSVGIGTASPAASLDIYATGATSAVIVPRDTEANRPAGVNGMIRYNTNSAKFEAFENGAWTNLSPIGAGSGDFMASGSVPMTGALRSIAGTVGAPGMTFVGDTSTGVWSPAAGSISLATFGTERMRISSNGNVGIGTTNPKSGLEVSGGAIVANSGGGATTLNGAIAAGATSLTLTSAADIGAPGLVAIDGEVISYTGVSGNDLTGLTRGVYGTTAAGHASGASVLGMPLIADPGTPGQYNAGLTLFGNGALALGAPQGLSTSYIGFQSLMMGWNNRTGSYSVAVGNGANASGSTSFAMGGGTEASGSGTRALGTYAIATGNYSTAIGTFLNTSAYNSFVIGRGNVGGGTVGSWVPSEPVFEIGIGTGHGPGSANAMTVLKNGRVAIGTATPAALFDIFSTGGLDSAMIVPRDTAANRPAGTNGMIRYNTNSNRFEAFQNGVWLDIISTGGGTADNLGNHTATTSILAITGTAATPSYSFNDNGNRGMYAAGTGALAFSTSSLERMRVDANGFVGIGLPNPAYTLDVGGIIRSNAYYVVQAYSSNGYSPTAEPFSPGIVMGNDYTADGSAVIVGMSPRNTAADYQRAYMGATAVNAGFTPAIFFMQQTGATTYNETMRIHSNGYLGIGTTAPAALLDVFSTGSTGSAIIVPRDTAANRPSGTNGMIRYNTNSNRFEAFQNGVWLDIVSTGGGSSDNLGNHTATTAILAVSGTAATPGYTFASDPDTGMWNVGANQIGFSVGNNERMRIDSSGNVGVNVAAPISRFQVNDNPWSVTGDYDATYLTTTYNSSTVNTGTITGVHNLTTANSTRTNNKFYGMFNDISLNNTGGTTDSIAAYNRLMPGSTTGTIGTAYGARNEIWSQSGATTIGEAAGAFNYAQITSATGTSNSVYASKNVVTNNNTGTVNSAYGVYSQITNTGGGTLSNAYGVFVDNITGTNKWGVYQVGVNDKNYFAANVGIGTLTPASHLDVTGTGAIIVPRNTTATRPFGVNGMIRYNTNSSRFEVYENSSWINMTPTGSGDNLGDHTATQQIVGTLGTNTAPGYSFAGDLDTGMWRNGSDQLSLSVGGSERVRLDTTYLTVRSNIVANDSGRSIAVGYTTNATGWSAIALGDAALSSGTGTVALGYVAQATATRSIAVGVNVTASGAHSLGMGRGTIVAGDSSIGIGAGAVSKNVSGQNSLGIFFGSPAAHMPLTWNNTMSIQGGNVGIGTTMPLAQLDVAGTGLNSAIVVPRDTSANRPTGVNGMIRFNSDTNKFEVYQGLWQDIIQASAADNLGNHTATTAILATTGTAATPSYSFGANGNRGLYAVGTGGLGFSTASLERMRVGANGYVGIGSAAPASALDVTGRISVDGLNAIHYPSSDTTAGGSIGIGPSALAQQASLASAAYHNTAIGYESMSSASMTSSALNNTGVGYQSMRAVTVGIENTAMGSLSLPALTTGIRNTSVGFQSLVSLNTGFYNTGLGFDTGLSITNQAYNTAVGAQALMWHTGYNNTAIGVSALAFPGAGSNNTALGFGAGQDITTGNYNIVIGAYPVATAGITSGDHNILIGTDVRPPSPTASNQLNVGNLIYATLLGTGSAASTGNVGIGSSDPSEKLTVLINSTEDPPHNGTPGAAGIKITNQDTTLNSISGITFGGTDDGGTERHSGAIAWGKDSNWVGGSGNYPGYISIWTRPDGGEEAERLRVTAAGNVGIGTLAPGARLDIFSTGSNSSAVIVPRDTTVQRPTGVNGMIRFNTTAQKFEVYQGLWVDMISAQVGEADTLATVTARGASTATATTFSGGLTSSGTLTLPGVGVNMITAGTGDGASYGSHNFSLQGWWGMALRDFGGTVHGLYDFRTGNLTTDGVVSFSGTGNNYFAGSVGVGTAPSSVLHVHSAARGGDLGISQQNDVTPYMRLGMDTSYVQYIANNAYWTGAAYNYVNTGGYGGLASRISQVSGTISLDNASGGTNPITWTPRLYMTAAGNIGIGTTTTPAWTSAYKVMAFNDAGQSIAVGSPSSNGIHFADGAYNDGAWKYAVTGTNVGVYSHGNGVHRFRVAGSGTAGGAITWTEGLYITNAGNVGIGTTTAGEKVEVNGNVKATSFISTSDRRLKTDIRPLENSTEKLSRINGVQYNWLSNGQADMGVIAQDVEKVYPELVVTNNETGLKAVKYQGLIAPLIESNKELYGMCKASQEQIDRLAKQVEELTAENAMLKQRLDNQQRQIQSIMQQLAK
jgi:hypothetical protein